MNSGTPVGPVASSVDIPDPRNTPAGMPDVDSESGSLDSNARLIWSMVRFTALEPPLKHSDHQGEAGFLWKGTLTSMLTDIWPILRQQGGNTQQAKLLLNQYLRLTHNMVCVDRGAGGDKRRSPLWWVRADWSDRLEDFRVTTTWPEPAGAQSQVELLEETDDVFGPGPLAEVAKADTVDAKVYTCEWPGCDMGENGGPFTSTRPNVIPLHRKLHENSERIIKATVRLLDGGADPETLTVLEIAAEAGVHTATVHNRFGRDELIELALARKNAAAGPGTVEHKTSKMAEAKALPAPAEGADLETWATRLVRVAAFADHNRVPLTIGALTDVMKIIDTGVRDQVWDHLVSAGLLVTRQDADYRGRGREVWVPADAEAVLADLRTRAPGSVDFVAELKALLDRYADMHTKLSVRDTALQEKDDAIQERDAELAAKDAELAEQGRLVAESRAELIELHKLVAPLIKFAGKPAQ